MDWEKIRKDLEEKQRLLEGHFELTEEEKREILLRRSREMAQKDRGEREDYRAGLEVEIGKETFLIDMDTVSEVIPFTEPTPIPCTPSFVMGMIHLRSRVYSILDLEEYYSLSTEGLNSFSHLLLLKEEEMELGVALRDMRGSRLVGVEEIQAVPPAWKKEASRSHLLGVTTGGESFLCGKKLLTDPAIIVEEEI